MRDPTRCTGLDKGALCGSRGAEYVGVMIQIVTDSLSAQFIDMS